MNTGKWFFLYELLLVSDDKKNERFAVVETLLYATNEEEAVAEGKKNWKVIRNSKKLYFPRVIYKIDLTD